MKKTDYIKYVKKEEMPEIPQEAPAIDDKHLDRDQKVNGLSATEKKLIEKKR